MKAVAIKHFGGPEELQIIDVPTPKPKSGEILIKIHYAAVNPVDWKIREGYLRTRLPHQFPIILGWDAAGEVAAIGENVKNFKVGDQVYAYCRKPVVSWGTFSEYVVIDATHAALKPKNITYAQASSIPLSALTAWQSLFDFAGLKETQSVLIHAGAGGVGSFAIQFAKLHNAKILTTASEGHHKYVKSLGADTIIDYTKEDFVTRTRDLFPEGVDIVYDCVGGKTLGQSWNCVKSGGYLVTICDFNIDQARAKEMGIHAGFVFVQPSGKELEKIASLIEQGKVIAPMIEEFPLEKASEALEKNRKGHTEGKIVLKVID